MLLPALLLATALSSQTPSWPPIDDDIGTAGGGENDAAVVVGISAYYDLPQIDGARENAEAWQQYLLRVRKVPSHKVYTFLDKQGSKELVAIGIKDAAKAVKPGGTLWFVFIGHGAPNKAGTDGLLLGADALQNVDSLNARGLPQEEVLALLGTGQQAETIAVFDACFSGKNGDGSADLVKGLQATLPVRKAPTAGAKKPTILAASDSFAGPLPGMARPAFSYLLLGALRGWGDDNGDRRVGLDEAFSFTRQTMQAVLRTADRLPSQRGSPSSLVVTAKASRPDVDAIVAGRCPSGSSWNVDRCTKAARIECPAGSSWNGSACASVCPAGTAWNGSACAATTVACPAGTTWDGRGCVGPELAVVSQPPARRGRRAGETMREPKTGAVWVWMPDGRFHHGCEPQDKQCDSDEKPGQKKSVEGFWMMQTEVTVAAYQACVRAGACERIDDDTPMMTCNGQNNRGEHPMNCVDWNAATAFCRWAGGRLPTAAEWEYAAKSGSSRVYPWGDEAPTGRRANFCDANCPTALDEASKKTWVDNGWVSFGEDDGWAGTAPVGSFARGDTPWGLKDMAGNVNEWTASSYDSSNKEMRGGSWRNSPPILRASCRYRDEPASRNVVLGFRCAQ
jgi:iron(II)-dependent oxidoreductase